MSKVIVVGAGNWGKNLVKNYYELGALAAVVESNEALRNSLSQDYPDIILYSDFEEGLRADTSAMVLATPAATHHALAKQALLRGKDVFVEKPMALTTKEAKDLAFLAEEDRKILMVGHLLLYQPAITWIRDYLASDEAGDVWHVATRRAKLGKVRNQENVWWSFAPHDVSVVLELLGRPKLRNIKAQGNALLQKTIEDTVDVLLEFETGQTAHIHSSWYWPQNERSTVILCEKKMIIYDEVKQSVTVYNKGINSDLSNRDEGFFEADVASQQPLKLECEHFLNCIKTRQTPHSDAWNGVAVVEILEKAQQAMNRA